MTNCERIHLVLLGDSASGKSIFCNLLRGKPFSKMIEATVGYDVFQIQVASTQIYVWDMGTANPQMNIYIPILKKADAVLIFQDATQIPSRETWKAFVKKNAPAKPLFYIRTKIECSSKKQSQQPTKQGADLGELALSQNPNLMPILETILSQLRKQHSVFYRRFGCHFW